jgi:Undecaprenyl-phosphate glucose phosphotransferase
VSTDREAARRLMVLLENEHEVETAPVAEIRTDLRLLGIDAAGAVAQAWRLADAERSPAAALLARIARAEAGEHEIAEIEGAHLEQVQARLAASQRPPPPEPARSRIAQLTPAHPLAAGPERRRGDWLTPPVIVGLLRLWEAGAIITAGALAFLTRFHSLEAFGEGQEVYAVVLAAVLGLYVFTVAGLYRFPHMTTLSAQAGRLLIGWASVMLVLLALGFATKAQLIEASRLWVGLWFVYGLFGLVIARLLLAQQIRRWQAQGRLARQVAIVGAGEHGRRLIEHLLGQGDGAIRIVGVFDDEAQGALREVGGLPVLGTVADLVTVARRQPLDQIIIALPWEAETRLPAWMQQLQSLPVEVSFCPHLAGTTLARARIAPVAGLPMLSIQDKPLAGWSYIVKSMEDRVLAAIILVVIAPLLALIALAIKLDSRGPLLFRQKRYGLDNQVIEVLKFRTLRREHCDDAQVMPVSRDDPRVTRIGRLLRRTSLDELPQFLNVLAGTMSIVGPRPHALAHDEHYARLIEAYLARRRVKPGITGWAQVNGLRGEIDSLERMEQRVRHDLYYIENWSLLLDLRIILRTVLVGFRDSYAY